MTGGTRLDTAFDKANRNILLGKIVKHKIKGNIGRCAKKFNRIYAFTANSESLEEQDLTSRVPQGTVLVPVFIIMISDMNDKVKERVLLITQKSARKQKKLTTDMMQKDLKTIYKWAKQSDMDFNNDKFEQMCHRENKKVPYIPNKGRNGEIIGEKCVGNLKLSEKTGFGAGKTYY